MYVCMIGGDVRIYEEIDSMESLKTVVEEYLSNHNMESKQPMPLVMFSDALVCMYICMYVCTVLPLF